jgi:acetylornithine deacetylase/succinyl-diaminopimelate desuccinylase-like protein
MELMALILLKRQGFSPERHIVYAATADEEAAGTWGVQWLMDNHPEKLMTRYVINEGVGFGFSTENSNLHLCQVAEKGPCWVRIRFEGRPGHGSLPHDENCVVVMAKAIEALASHSFPIRITGPVQEFIKGLAPLQEFMPEEQFLGILDETRCQDVLERIPEKRLRQMLSVALKNTAVPTVASAGSKTNVIPSECFCEVDCRILPGFTSEELLKDIDEILLARGCRNFSIEFEGTPLASESPLDTPLYKALESSFVQNDPRAKVVPYMSPGATDSRFFRQKGIPAYGVQFDSSIETAELIHGHNERIGLNQLTCGIKVLYDTVKSFCV